MTKQIIKHTGNMPSDFTGVVYNDTGKNNYAAMISGEWLRQKNHRVRWFATAETASLAIDGWRQGRNRLTIQG